MRGAVRLAALSDVHVIYSWTHDSVGLGQDGPTHQPVEQLAAVRAMPDLRVIRPADANETAQAWRIAVDGDGPDRPDPHPPGASRCWPRPPRLAAEGVARGAYVLREPASGRPRSSSSAPAARSTLCLAAADLLADRRRRRPGWCPSRRGTCSPPSPTAYRTEVLPDGVPRLAVEAATSFGWERYADATRGHRPLRGVGPRRRRPAGVRLHPRTRRHRATTLLGGRGRSAR